MYCQSKHLLSVQTRIVSPNMIQKQAKCKQKMINPFPNKPWFLRVYRGITHAGFYGMYASPNTEYRKKNLLLILSYIFSKNNYGIEDLI